MKITSLSHSLSFHLHNKVSGRNVIKWRKGLGIHLYSYNLSNWKYVNRTVYWILSSLIIRMIFDGFNRFVDRNSSSFFDGAKLKKQVLKFIGDFILNVFWNILNDINGTVTVRPECTWCIIGIFNYWKKAQDEYFYSHFHTSFFSVLFCHLPFTHPSYCSSPLAYCIL